MVSQIAGGDEVDLRVILGHQVGVLTDAAHQHTGEEEVRHDHDAAEAEPDDVAQSGLHEREGHSRIHRLPPAESETLDKHPRHLGHVGVGIGIGGPPSDNHQKRFRERYVIALTLDRLSDPGSRCRHHQAIDTELSPVIDRKAGFRRVGVEHRRDVVLGMPCREEHRRDRQDAGDPLLPQRLKPVAQDRPGEFEIAVRDRHRGQPRPQLFDHAGEFLHRQTVAAAMAADQHPEPVFGACGAEIRQDVGSTDRMG